LINIKRIAYAVRKPEEAFQVPAAAAGGSVQRGTVIAAVERYLAGRGISSAATADVPAIVDRFLSAKKSGRTGDSPVQSRAGESPAPPPPAPLAPVIVPFVCENDVRDAISATRKIYVGPKTIVTPSARDLGDQFGILVLAQR
jgi:acetaldehyde dehydrogenase (acetylating)